MDVRKVVAAALMVASMVIVVDRLFLPAPIRIVVEGGTPVAVQGEVFFTPEEGVVLAGFSWVGGLSAAYLLFSGRRGESPRGPADPERVKMALSLLEEDEKRLLQELVDRGGTLNQSDLVVQTRFSESKVSRLLDRLEGRGLVARVRQGMGNVVTLRKW